MNVAGSDIILERLMSLHPKIIDLTLGRMHRLLAMLGNPERALPPVVHIAGTNGKGSTLAMIRAGLEAEGYRVHAYTSPHLVRFHERILVAGELISEPALAALLEECEVANGGEQITFFEITTCAALLAYARTPADYLLLEVGLGGRLDSTNVIAKPRLSVITPVSIDHQQFLGEKLAQIAFEKAGILKAGVPCIVGPQPDAALSRIEEQAAVVGAPLQIANRDWQVWEEHGRVAFLDPNGLVDLPMPALIGRHQVENAGIALAALRALDISEEACAAALSQAKWPARLQRLHTGPLSDAAGTAELWLDGGHNAAAGEALAEALGRLPARPLHLICGMLRTKDASGYMLPLAARARHLHAVAIPGESATLTPDEITAAAQAAGMQASVATGVMSAIKAIVTEAPNARILICGSLYLAGHVLRLNG